MNRIHIGQNPIRTQQGKRTHLKPFPFLTVINLYGIFSGSKFQPAVFPVLHRNEEMLVIYGCFGTLPV